MDEVRKERLKKKIKRSEIIRRSVWLLLILWIGFNAHLSVTLAITLLMVVQDLQAKHNTMQSDYNIVLHDWSAEVNKAMTRIADTLEEEGVDNDTNI